ncbi:hypothetical protein NDS46_08670 [Paenibacillus thiaminolyticus]|uniref:hypothetical protein n=1 Tax=Paenibacillus thiaminolyticus TaxID=49283 RepID=UPI002330E33C|nr:hypothetical protein [Paenibacillus thiaminolyticus]WCF09908.1 hypothetical protein NDS46_08670 [Paenibacillus thiaminolyticus]
MSMNSSGRAEAKKQFKVYQNDTFPVIPSLPKKLEFNYNQMDQEAFEDLRYNPFHEIIAGYAQVASSEHDQKDGDGMGNDLGRYIDRLDSDFREREQRLSKDAAERESRLHQQIIEQDKRYREEMKAIEERNEKLVSRISEEIKELRSEVRHEIYRVVDKIDSMKKHTQVLVITTIFGLLATVVAVATLAIQAISSK